MATTVFRNDAARQRIAGWYDRFLARANVPVEHRTVPTAQGPSHVLFAGDPAGPLLVCLHGALASSAHLLGELVPLAARFRLVLVDVPGQSVRAPEVRLPLDDDTFPRWLLEVLDGLELADVHLLGVSWGGSIARKTASLAPDRVRRLVLMVPAGLVTGPVWAGLTRMGVPLAMYRLFPTERRLRKFLGGLLTTWDDDWAGYLGDAFRDYNLDMRVPPRATDDDLRALPMPTLVIAGRHDLSFPGEKLIRRVTGRIPRVETELIDARHCPPTTPEFRAWTAERVTRFLTADRTPAVGAVSEEART
ncbi:MAG TPA: alpha/beta fold hydrolase [Gemmataceae bacterium]|jgi:2-hydroxy-6-oxonona-2,4-dienedioate hydrolase|nr:alpha/beta fold hydrolase [Gemmataceae bacterium]